MFRLLVSVFVFALPLAATSFTAITSSQNDGSCSNVNLPNPTSCLTFSSNEPYAHGFVTAFAGFGSRSGLFNGDMALASMQLNAVCFALPFCLAQDGMADAEVDLAVHGEPPGTPGLLEIAPFLMTSFDASAATHITGLTFSGLLISPHGGSLYNFIYERPFRISATVDGS